MNEDIINDVNLVMQQVYSDPSGAEDTPPEDEIIHVHHFPDAQLIKLPDGTVIFKKIESTQTNIPVVDSTPQDSPATQPSLLPAYFMVSMFLFLMLSSILFQFSVLFNPLTVNITLAARSQQVTLNGTLQLGHVVNPITLSQSQTVPTTGHGHQDATRATGLVTLYNAAFTPQTVDAGTIYTGADGVQVITDNTVTIPADNPPVIGQASVLSHAVNAGSQGNIQALEINYAVSNSLYIKNLAAFTGGQDERNYQSVAKSNIDLTASQLKDTLNQATQGALQGEVKHGEQLQTFPCSPTITSDHHTGEEATQVKVTVSETCSGIAYNSQELINHVTQLLTTQATTKLGSGYSMLENPQITITSATPAKPVMLSFRAISTWIYALTTKEQRYIKTIIAGKYTQQALQFLNSLPGIESVSMQTSGFGDDTKLPKDISHIHMLVIYTAA